MNKKAGFILSGELILWIPRMLLLIITLFSVVWILGAQVSRSSDTSDVEFYILTNRLFYSQNCFSYDGKSIVDANKFDQSVLENCISFGDHAAANLILDYNGKNIELIANEDLFKRGFYARSLRSKYSYKIDERHILVFEGDKIYPGRISIGAVFRNE